MNKSTITITLSDTSIVGPLKEMSVTMDFDETVSMETRERLVYMKLVELGRDWKKLVTGDSEYIKEYVEA